MTAKPPPSPPPSRDEQADAGTPHPIDDAPVADDHGFPDAKSPRQ